MSQSLSRWTGSVLPATRGVGWLAALSLHHATLFYKSSRLEFRAVLLCWSGVLALLRREGAHLAVLAVHGRLRARATLWR